MELKDILLALKKWKDLLDQYDNDTSDKTGTKILSYLNQGAVFTVDYNDVEQWDKSFENSGEPYNNDEIDYIHAYVGINADDLLNFYLISSNDDRNANFSEIQVKSFDRPKSLYIPVEETESLSSNQITINAAIARNFYWNMFCGTWLNKLKGNPIFRLITIPFKDYKELGLLEKESCYSFFGLADNNNRGYDIEIITVKELSLPEICKDAENLSSPRPPFHFETEADFQLLLLSNALE